MTWMLTASGNTFDLRWLPAQDVCIADIAHALALQNRFHGHTLRPYSVAEHSLLVAEIMERDMGIDSPGALLAGLLHDAHEAYCSDLSTPMKRLIGPAWDACEARIQHAVRGALGVLAASAGWRDEIHHADLVALATERRDVLAPSMAEWPSLAGVEPSETVRLSSRACFDWRHWRQAYVDRFSALACQVIEQRLGRAATADTEGGAP